MKSKNILAGVAITAIVFSSVSGHLERANGSNNLQQSEESVEAVQQTAFSVSKDKNKQTLRQYRHAKSLTDRELVELLKAVGFKGEGLRTAWAVAKSESNGRPFALNNNIKTGDNSYGIFQINMIGSLGPDRRAKFGIQSNDELFNPVKNAKIAYYMTQGGKNWKSWKYANTPPVKKWLAHFPEPKTKRAL